jgi:uncharacterized iron-regulated protein
VRARAGVWLEPATGAEVAHPAMMARAAAAGVVLLGETHDRADHHRWQLSVLAGLAAHRPDLVVGFEMFPAAADLVLAEWVSGGLAEVDFLERTDWAKVWGFAAELYLPLFQFCRLHRLPMVGLNCARDLVRAVGAGGWNAVPEAAREGITPAAAATPAYRAYLFAMTGGRREGREAQHAMDPAFDRFVRAQQTWDRAFACRIAAARRGRRSGPGREQDLDLSTPGAAGAVSPNRSGPKVEGELDVSSAGADAPLIAAIIGRGHLEFGGGTPHQLADLGITDALVLLPVDAGTDVAPGIADAVFGLDPPPA